MYIIWFGLNHAGQSALKKAIISLSQMKPLHALFSLNCISFCAAVSMVGDYHCDSMDPKRYSVDPSDSAYGAMSSPYTASKPAYGFRSSTAYSGGVCRQAASPSTFQEGNRSGKRGNFHLFTEAAIVFPHYFRWEDNSLYVRRHQETIKTMKTKWCMYDFHNVENLQNLVIKIEFIVQAWNVMEFDD